MRSVPRRRDGWSVRRLRARAPARRRSFGHGPGGGGAPTRDATRASPDDTLIPARTCHVAGAWGSRRVPSRRATGGSDGAVERVAGVRIAALVAGREPVLALVGRA